MGNLRKIIDTTPETIETLFKNVYTIPVFQRPYKWNSDEILEFLTDLETSIESDKYWFVGTLHIKFKKSINSSLFEYDIIDGQQRLTTVALILMAIQNISAKTSHEIIDIKKQLYKEGKFLIENEGIEKDIVNYIFESAYKNPFNLIENLNIYHVKNKIEENFKNNFKLIYDKILELSKKIPIIDIYQFMRTKMIFNTINLRLPYKEMFEIFDSINSKGKALDEIDKIKSFIFCNLDESDYNSYLKKWGKLIEKTEDNLEDYVYIFMKAYLKFYKATGMKYFKAFCNNELKIFYNTTSLSDALKAFVDDLYKYVSVYVDMRKSKLPYKNNKAEFYMKAISHLKYIHPLPLIFRVLCEYKYKKLEKEKANKLITQSFIFMFNFQTMTERDSKETQEFFAKLMPQLYNKELDVDFVIKQFKKELRDRGITTQTVKERIKEHIAYVDTATKEAYILLIFYEFSNRSGKIDYDKGLWILDNKKIIQCDHILPVNPEKNRKFKYAKVIVSGEEKLKLYRNNDFIKHLGIYDGMEYDEFKRTILDKIGNIQICWRKDNIDKSNKFIKLTDYSNYTTYTQIKDRTENLVNIVSSTELFDI